MSDGAVRRSAVIHGHFYQPPREDPALDLVEREPSAAPFHDWNERIDHECYQAVLAARIIDESGAIERIVNTLEWISFNVGPTLLEWMERESPSSYRGILAADRASAARLDGLGNAIAMPYHHSILPLSSRHDKVTEVRWGIADFRRRFGREPVGMWLPETAVDDDTLDVLASEGIAFTVVAPHQLVAPPPNGLPGRYRTGRGRTITLFGYDGALSHDVAFGPLVKDAALWIKRLRNVVPRAPGPDLVSIATDGETYGHHHKFGEMALAATLDGLLSRPDLLRVENFASFLARHPAEHEVTLVEPSSWSCTHGVERWRSDCGCRMTLGTSQAWRAPLRSAMEWLVEELHAIYAAEAPGFFADPWGARTGYAITGSPSDVPPRGRELLEMERNTLRVLTSCGWFFDDVAGIETVQILKYAARAIDLAGPVHAARLEAGLLARLAQARSNDRAKGTAAVLYHRQARGRWPADARVAAGFAAMSALCPGQSRHLIGAFLVGALGDGVIQTQHRRTGQVERFTTRIHRTAGFGLEIELTRTRTGDSEQLPLEALPERERSQAREVLRREALRDVLTAEDLVRLAHGSIDYPDALRSAVIRLIPERLHEATPDAAAKLGRSLDLLALEALPVPLEAQSRFYQLLAGADPAVVPWLAALAGRLGFGKGAFNGVAKAPAAGDSRARPDPAASLREERNPRIDR